MNISIENATLDNVNDIAAIHVAGWQGAYGGVIDQNYIDAQTLADRESQWTDILKTAEGETLVASVEGKAVGFISYGPLRTAPPGTSKVRPAYSSEIYAFYLLPDYYRKGIGTTLFQKAVENLQGLKHQSICLWVLAKNTRACAFYEAFGGTRIGKKMVEFGPTKAKEVCYGWRDLTELKKT